MPAKKVLKLYYLSTCSTCTRIMKDLKIKNYPFQLQDIKTQPVTEQQIDEMQKMTGSYLALFSKVALKFRGWGLNEMELTEQDYRKYILQEYTFLKRPVFIIGKKIFVGNAPKTIAAVASELKLSSS